MQPLQDIVVASQMAREHEASLFPAPSPRGRYSGGGRTVRRWLGRQLVRTGIWLATDVPMRAAPAR
jgi:hypothetical protein